MSLKRQRDDESFIEHLPNELFLEIFSYLRPVDVIWTFARLNQRFHYLAWNSSDKFDFKSVSKTKFDYVTRTYPKQYCRSLRLSDDDQTPGQISYFFQSSPMAQSLSQLESLTIINMQSQTALMIIPKLSSFTQLVSLNIGSICGQRLPALRIPSLKYLVIDSCMHTQWMKNLELIHLEHKIECQCKHEHDLIWPKTIQILKVSFAKSGDHDIVQLSLRNLVQLTTLAVFDTTWQSSPPNGQIWQELISSSFPLLQRFHFAFKFWKDFTPNSDISRVVSTFSTPFYLQEKSWFIQCDYHHLPMSVAFLYSIPYAFQRFDLIRHTFDESMTNINPLPINNIHRNVRTLMVDVKCQSINHTIIQGYITHLCLKFSGHLMDWIYSMNHLRQLSLDNHITVSSQDFIRLMTNARHLDSLIIPYHTLASLTNQWRHHQACRLLSQRIRSLNIPSSTPLNDYIKVEELVHLIRVFRHRCQHLNISIYSRNLLAGFILKNMKYLRSLHVRFQEYGNDMMISQQWLIEQNSDYQKLDCHIVTNGNEYTFWFACRS